MLRSVVNRRITGLLQFCRYSHYNVPEGKPKMTLPRLYEMFHEKVPITCITAHDALSSRLADLAGSDIILVGDSLAMVAMGLESTSKIELDEMIYHTKAVTRGAQSAFIVADLPFGSYESSTTQACESAIKMIKRGGAEAVKFEGGRELEPIVRHLSSFGICTMPHIGLTPQRQVSTGGFKVQGRTAGSALRIYEDALILQEAGASMLLLEGVPDRIAAYISSKLRIPTIGIGAGPHTSGQVLVQIDMLGGFDAFTPKFLKRYSNYLQENTRAIKQYCDEVKQREFPERKHSYVIKDEEFEDFVKLARDL